MAKKDQVKVGQVWRAMVNGRVVPCRIDAIKEHEGRTQTGYKCNNVTHYDVTNLTTGRRTTFRSAMKFRELVQEAVVHTDHLGRVLTRAPGPDASERAFDAADLASQREEGLPVEPKEDEQRADPTPASAPVLPAQSTPAPTVSSDQNGSVAPATDTPLASILRRATEPATGAANQVVEALAGTGKTTTCVVGLMHVKGLGTGGLTPSDQQRAVWDAIGADRTTTVRISSFASKITDELKDRCTATGLDRLGVEARGIHSLGFAAARQRFGKLSANNAKWVVPDIVCGLLKTDLRAVKGTPLNAAVWAADELVSLCKQTLTEPTAEGLDALTSRFDVDLTGCKAQVYELVPQALEACRVPQDGRITFDDMIWLALVHDLPVHRVDLQIVDESQDLNRMQQELMLRSGHRLLFVGDRHQAIYGFAGADAESMDRIGAFLAASPRGCATLPLTTTRRCGKAIVREAQRFVPEYEAHPSNPEGSVERADLREGAARQYRRLARPGDMVLCRCNAPLVSQCLRFVKEGTKASILGKKDMGAQLAVMLDKSKASTTPDLLSWLGDWLVAEVANENAKRYPSEARIENLQDRHDCLAAFCEGERSVDGVRARIAAVFTDAKDAKGVTLGSIHKSKGLEAQRVFILQPKGVGPRQDKMQPWELEQEQNLRYVAVTRAIETLTYVS